MAARAPEQERLHSLTGLRAVAALAVYISHLPVPIGAPAVLVTAMANGYCGVTFFFTLSGFVLAINYFDRLDRPSAGAIWRFLTARFARVYPLYLLVLVYILARTHQLGAPLPDWQEHVLALQAWDPRLDVAYGYNGPGWSISVEFFLYAMFPLLVPFMARADRGVRSLVILVAAVVALMGLLVVWLSIGEPRALSDPNSAFRWLYRTPALRLGDFLLGILAARLYLRLRNRQRMHVLGWALTGGAILWTALALVNRGLFLQPVSFDLLYAIPAFALLLGLSVAPRTFVARMLSLPVMILFGEASYAFYLIHQPLTWMLGPNGWTNVVSWSTVAVQCFNLLLVIAVAVGLHVLVERPAREKLRMALASLPDRVVGLRLAILDSGWVTRRRRPTTLE
jgi:peptidoglycan/LPS O-acetylase OafA/YrhL